MNVAGSSPLASRSIWAVETASGGTPPLGSFLHRARTEVEGALLSSSSVQWPTEEGYQSPQVPNHRDSDLWPAGSPNTPSFPLDPNKQTALEGIFGLRPRSSSVPPPRQEPSKQQRAPLFDVLAAATSGERPGARSSQQRATSLVRPYAEPASPRLVVDPNHFQDLLNKPRRLSPMSEERSLQQQPIPRRDRSQSIQVSPPHAQQPMAANSSPLSRSYQHSQQGPQPASLPAERPHPHEWQYDSLYTEDDLQRGRGSPTTARLNPNYNGESYDGGIASTNVSPFTRDGARLPSLGQPRREHSLGAVGSGRRRPEPPLWNGGGTSRSLVFAEIGDNDSDDEAPPTRSGATSRRHSLATVPGRSQIGFQLPEHMSQQLHSTNDRFSSGPRNPYEDSHGPRSLPSSATMAGSHGLRFGDDELADSLNSLQLEMDTRQSREQEQPFQTRRYDAISPTSHYNQRTLYGSSPNRHGNPLPPPPQQQPYYGDARRINPYANPYSQASNGLSATAQPFTAPPSGGAGFDASLRPVYFGAQTQQEPDLAEFGRGIPLHQVPSSSPLFIVEFKAGRTDIFYIGDTSMSVITGDVVIVEADRGKDLGTVLHDNISLQDVQAFQKHQVEQALGQIAVNPPYRAGPLSSQQTISRLTREVHPKRILSKATSTDIQLLSSKAADESKALALCRAKVVQKNLEMEVTDAEWQFDRRKLTFFYIADKRIDFRELVRELFRLYKTRIWLAPVEKKGEGRF